MSGRKKDTDIEAMSKWPAFLMLERKSGDLGSINLDTVKVIGIRKGLREVSIFYSDGSRGSYGDLTDKSIKEIENFIRTSHSILFEFKVNVHE